MTTFNAGAIEARLTLDRSAWVRDYRETLAEVQRLENLAIDIAVDADTRAFANSVDGVQRQLRDLESTSVDIPVDADTRVAANSLALLQRQISAMDGQTINVDVDIDRRGLTALNTQVRSLVGGGGGGGGHMGLLRLALIALVALSPVVSSAILGIVGAVVAFAGAATSAAGAAGVLAFGIGGLIGRFKELRDSGDPLPPQYQALADSLDSLSGAYDSFLDSIEGPGLDLMVQAVDTLTRIVPDLTPIFENSADAVSGLLDQFNGWIGGSDYTEMLDFFGRIGPDMITSFGRIFGNLAVFFGQTMDAFEPVIRDMMGGLEEITAGWADWARGLEENEGFQDFLEDIQTYGPLVIDLIVQIWNAFRNLGEALEPFAGPMLTGLTTFFQFIADMNPDTLSLIITGVGLLWGAIQLGGPIIAGVTALLSPWGLAIAAIAGIVAAVALAVIQLWDTNKGFRDDVMGIWEDIQGTIGPIIEDIQGYLENHRGTVRRAGEVWTEFKNMIASAVELAGVIIGHFLSFVRAIWSRWGDDIMRILDGALQGVLQIIRGVFRIIGGIFEMWTGLLSGDWRQMFQGMQQIASGGMQILRTLWQGFLAWWRGILGTIRNAATTGFQNMAQATRNIVSGLISGIQGMWDRFVNWFGGIGGRISGAAAGMWNGITSALSGVIQNARDLINSQGFDIHVPEAFPGPSTYHVGVQLARGGVITSPIVAEIGEGGETEIVTPERLMREIVAEHSSGTEIDYGRMAEAVAASLTRALIDSGMADTQHGDITIPVYPGPDPQQVVAQTVDGVSFELRRLGFGGKRNV